MRYTESLKASTMINRNETTPKAVQKRNDDVYIYHKRDSES
jgi:hypothetical protein